MTSEVVRVLAAIAVIAAIGLSAPLVQPDLADSADPGVMGGEYGAEIQQAIGETGATGMLEGSAGSAGDGEGGDASADPAAGENGGSASDGEDGEASDGSGAGENGDSPGDGTEPLQGDKYSEDDREKLRSENDSEGEGTEGGLESGPSALRYGAVKQPYWRTQAYDIYTGDKWIKSEGAEQFEGGIETESGVDRRSYEIELAMDATLVPAPYRPAGTDLEQPVLAGGGGGLQTSETIPAGTTFTVSSDVPQWTYEELETAPKEYDEAMIERYGTPATETTERVHEKTDDITANASTPYQQAVAIEYWLKNNRQYSLEVAEPSGNVADQFLFEMEKGYCQYYATSMTVMLRTQGIPARYVRGYARSSVDENGTERVSLGNAHAWTEVYFEGVGWVKFDPTAPAEPGSGVDSRTTAIELQEADGATGDEVLVDTVPAGHHSFDRDIAVTPTAAQSEDDWKVVDADVTLLTDPTPGTNGTVRVTDDGAPLADHRVSFNGDVVGLTNDSGEVTGRLPYTAELEVTVERFTAPGEPDEEDATETENSTKEEEGSDGTEQESDGNESDGTDQESTGNESDESQTESESSDGSDGENQPPNDSEDGTDGGESQGGQGGEGNSGTVGSQFSSRETSIGGSIDTVPSKTFFVVHHGASDTEGEGLQTARRTAPDDRWKTKPLIRGGESASINERPFANSTRIPLDADADIAVGDRPLHPGGTATVTATVNDRPIPNATVTVGNETYTTDADGTVTIDVPYTATTTIGVERGEVAGQTTVEVHTAPTVAFVNEPTPGESATIEVTIDGTPVRDLTVLADGASIDRTGENGTATVPVPYAERIHVVVERGDVSAATNATLPTNLTVTSGGPPIPGMPVEVAVSLDGDPVPNASIRTDADTTFETDENGTAAVQIPTMPRRSLEVVAQRGAATGTATIDVTRPWAIVGIGLLAVLLIGGWRVDVRQRGRNLVRRGERTAAYLSGLSRGFVTAIVRTAAWVGRVVAQGGRGTVGKVRGIIQAVIALAAGVRRAVPGLLSRFRSWLARQVSAVRNRIEAFVSWAGVGPGVWLARLRSRVSGIRSGPEDGAGAGETADGHSAVSEEPQRGPIEIIVDTWEWLVSVVGPRPSLTPGEIADRAIDLGLPKGPVQRVLQAFRAVRYGRTGPTATDAEQLSKAEQALRSAREGDE